MPHRWGSSCALALSLAAGSVETASRGQLAAAASSDDTAGQTLSGAWTLNAGLSDSVPPDDAAEHTLVITVGAGTVTFYGRDGSRRVYRLSGRPERHNLGSGMVWISATWDGATLRMDIEGGRGIRITQTFTVDRERRRLIVTSTPDQHRLPMNAVRLIYDPVIDRGL